MESTNYVHLIGDSTLDNIWWHLENTGTRENPDFNTKLAEEKSVEGKLKQYLKNCYKIINNAYDGFKTTSLLQGDYVGRVFPGYHFKESNPKFNDYFNNKQFSEIDTDIKNQKIVPLDILGHFINQDKNANHYVVLSVCGNDFRENLLNPVSLLLNIFTVQKKYLKIVSKIQKLGSNNIKPILMFQYRTDANSDSYKIYTILKVVGRLTAAIQILSFVAMGIAGVKRYQGSFTRNTTLTIIGISLSLLYGSTRFVPLKNIKNILFGRHIGVSTFGCLLEKLYQPMLEKAKKDQIPVLDLSNSFNPFDELLYTASIEPNEKGSELIAEGISLIVNNYSICEGKTAAKDNSIMFKLKDINPKKWEVAYPKNSSDKQV